MSNAKIQFTVKFDNIPKEVLNKLNEVNSILDVTSQTSIDVSAFIEENNFFEALDRIKEIRESLNYVDMVFEDSYNILAAYASHKTKILESQKQDTVQEEQKQGE